MLTYIKFPSFTPKAGIKKWPLIGDICIYVFNSLFINRSATPEERAQIMEDIKQRQILSETGKVQPILIFPEGCTTNHTSIVTFRRGAFFAERSIQPFTLEYSSPYFNVAHDILNFLAHIILITSQPYVTCRVKMLPVFQPNEWFFSNHKKDGEERWETYMRVMRDIVSEHSGKPLSNQRMEDKFLSLIHI